MYVYEVYWNDVPNHCAGWFSSEKRAMTAIKWLTEKIGGSGEFFIRKRQVDVINGRYAYTELGIEDPDSVMIDDIKIKFED